MQTHNPLEDSRQAARKESFAKGLAGLAELKRVYASKPVPAILKVNLRKLPFDEFCSLCDLWLTDDESKQFLENLKKNHLITATATSKTPKVVLDTAHIRTFTYTKYFTKRLRERFLEDNQ